uniref:Uncharacterized protein n=1 Tax=Arabidopsis thaliana TaxID=3702 RepID=Q9LTN4_ARATH|nr:unnamed protein product [Arabidopsis thaliana]
MSTFLQDLQALSHAPIFKDLPALPRAPISEDSQALLQSSIFEDRRALKRAYIFPPIAILRLLQKSTLAQTKNFSLVRAKLACFRFQKNIRQSQETFSRRTRGGLIMGYGLCPLCPIRPKHK